MPSAVAWHEVHSKAARQCSVLRSIACYPQALLMACWRPSTAASHHKGQKGQLCAAASTGLQLLRQQAILPFCVRGLLPYPVGGAHRCLAAKHGWEAITALYLCCSISHPEAFCTLPHTWGAMQASWERPLVLLTTGDSRGR